jgi:hypothetical protein
MFKYLNLIDKYDYMSMKKQRKHNGYFNIVDCINWKEDDGKIVFDVNDDFQHKEWNGMRKLIFNRWLIEEENNQIS